MPNLILSLDTASFYDQDIKRYYPFEKCEIEFELDYQLFRAEGRFNNEESILYLLEDLKGKHLSILRLVPIEIKNKEFHQIKKSYSVIPNQGFGEILYTLVFSYHGFNIVSDSYNTLPGSFNLWLKLINKWKYNIQILNANTGISKRIIKPVNELLIWGVPSEYLEEIDSTDWGGFSLEDEFNQEFINDDEDDEFSVSYLSEHDKYERTFLSDYIVKALKNKRRIKDRENTLLLVLNS